MGEVDPCDSQRSPRRPGKDLMYRPVSSGDQKPSESYSGSVSVPNDERYELDYSARLLGLMLIINIFSVRYEEDRKGSQKDVENLKKMAKELRLDHVVVEEKNLKTEEGIMRELKKFSKDPKHKKTGGLVVVAIGSHGGWRSELATDGYFLSSDGKPINISQIYSIFSNECSELIGKPKWFIFQCCRGKKKDTGTQLDSASNSAGAPPKPTVLPTFSDILVSHSTIPEHVSLRNSYKGSFFIDELSKEILDRSEKSVLHSTELVRVLKNQVAGRLGRREGVYEGSKIKQSMELRIFGQFKDVYLAAPPTSQ